MNIADSSSSSSGSDALVQYIAPLSHFEHKFWQELYDLKLNVLRLNSDKQSIKLRYLPSSNDINEPLQFNSSCISSTSSSGCYISGELINMNTIEEFKLCDKKICMNNMADQILDDIRNGNAIKDPRLLTPFLLLTFADLKSYRFTYWLCLPAIIPANRQSFSYLSPPTLIKLTENSSNDSLVVVVYRNLINLINRCCSGIIPFVFGLMKSVSSTADCQWQWQVHSLEDVWMNRYNTNDVIFVILDNGSSSCTTWMLRNFLTLLSVHSSSSLSQTSIAMPHSVRIISLRGKLIKSMLKLDDITAAERMITECNDADILSKDESLIYTINLPSKDYTIVDKTIVGWEANDRGKPGPRVVDLKSILDSKRIMSQAVDLNLRLMKWRLWPKLDTEKLAATKCLLFGAGTLGCAVARVLIGWGVRHITFIDNGKVSYSNPTRQCLFEFNDCETHQYKAVAAAKALQRIFPDVISEGIVLTIPMPGHELSDDDVDKDIVKTIDTLVQSHDVCFALTDSREGRWLPTMLCSAYDKLIINSALGFDSYLVMRHGHGVYNTTAKYDRLGCYFCNDIVAAVNSQKDRSLDQQCTVTRPGLSYIAAGIAVELMVAILHSPLYHTHPAADHSNATSKPVPDDSVSPIPHQLRGSLMRFTQIAPVTNGFSCCTACSRSVTDAYLADPHAFVRHVCSNSLVLEDISGIAALTSSIDIDNCFIDSDDDDDVSM